ncbi:MAG: Loki-CTERM sorting domain-containing protein [Promethearchaeota archaeon]
MLQSATVHADGIVVASLTLESAGIIPGYEIPLILGITSLTIIAIILYKKKKNTNIK